MMPGITCHFAHPHRQALALMRPSFGRWDAFDKRDDYPHPRLANASA